MTDRTGTRITKLIAQGSRWRLLTVVTAPAGAGKTIALTLWAAAGRGTVAWVGLDEFDNRPGVFWGNIVAALRRSGVAELITHGPVRLLPSVKALRGTAAAGRPEHP
jgi:LuxR family maltose regulon positive regulatory protein